ncbi:MAG: 3-methyl-2-oxobutanoate hydroxymethyltransferase [Planctomycetaceae bacterium]|nr:3-methyl-2-oxobutanoate hydroxymethyltransferase [Planctomycetaceae bacterium]
MLPGRPTPGQAEPKPTPAAGAWPGPDPTLAPVTVRSLQRAMREGKTFAALTCYDATTARWLERAGVPVLLVGDTAAEMVLGHPNTLHAPLDFLITLTAAVKRGAPRCLVMADMPFMSYQTSDADGVRNAGRFMTEGMADCVKLEVDASFAPLVALMTRAGVPVVAHIGSRPQHAKQVGGYAAAGKTADEAIRIIADADAMLAAGASMLLVEATPLEVTEEIVRRSTVPVIGCGAGAGCHGQVVVLHDLLGLTERQPPFALPIAQLGSQLSAVADTWKSRVREGTLGEHPYALADRERAEFLRRIGRSAASDASTGGDARNT